MNDFKVNDNKKVWKMVKLMTPEVKKENWNFEFWVLCAVNLIFLFKVHKNTRFLSSLFCVVYGLWCKYFAGNIVLGAQLNLLRLVAFHHHLVTYLLSRCYSKWVGNSESLKTYFDKKEDITLADIIMKIRKLPKCWSTATCWSSSQT